MTMIRIGNEEIPAQRLLDYLTRTDELLLLILEELRAIREKPVTEVTVPTEVGEAIAEALSAKAMLGIFPFDPEVLNRLLAGIWVTKYIGINFPSWAISLSCPDGATSTLTYPLPDGWYCLQHVCYLYATFHDPAIIATVLVDGETCTAPFGIALTADMPVEFGQHYVKKENLQLQVVNNSGADTLVTLQITCNMVLRTFYKDFYEPLLLKAYEACEKLVES